jgi:8-oxo-dGTP pyrophosphatase MutT (NUDIX family)
MTNLQEGMRAWIESQRLKAQMRQWSRGHVRSDADEPLKEGERWVTINGSAVLIGKDGKVVGGAEGKMQGEELSKAKGGPAEGSKSGGEGEEAKKEPPMGDEIGKINKQLIAAEADYAEKKKAQEALGKVKKGNYDASEHIKAEKAVWDSSQHVKNLRIKLRTANEQSKAMPQENPKNAENEQAAAVKKEQETATAAEKQATEEERAHDLKKEEIKASAKKEGTPGPTTTTETTKEKVHANGSKEVTKEAKTETAPAAPPESKNEGDEADSKIAEIKAAQAELLPKFKDGTVTSADRSKYADLGMELSTLQSQKQWREEQKAEAEEAKKDPTKILSSEKKALNSYSFHAAKGTNTGLRKGGDYNKGMVAQIDSVMKKSKLPDGMKLSRYIDNESVQKMFGGTPKVGDTYTDKAYMSTTKGKEAMGTGAATTTKFEIVTADGQHGVDMAPYAKFVDEQEVLLPRNTTIKVLSVSKGVVKAEIVPTGTEDDSRADSDTPIEKPYVVINGLKQAAGILFITNNGRILLGRRAETGEYQGYWGIFGGHMEAGETPEMTALREVFEETGHHVGAAVQNEGDDALPPPLQSIATTEVDGTEFTYFVNVCKPFDVILNDEHTGYEWFSLGALPEPMIPGLAEVVNSHTVTKLRLSKMHETDVARAMVIGGLPSPQKFANMTLYKMRVTGTGHAVRHGKPEEVNDKGVVTKEAIPDEHVFRDPDNYLNEDFLDRCRGLAVIFDHPKKRILNSKEWRERSIGILVQPWIDAEKKEVWGIAKVYDADSTLILDNEKMSTSPAVVFQDKTVNSTIALNDGSTLLIEGNPGLLDHLAVCEVGVWDKGMDPTGVESESVES